MATAKIACVECNGFGYTRATCAEMATRYVCFSFVEDNCAFSRFETYGPKKERDAHREAHKEVVETRTLQQGSGCPVCLGVGY